MIKKILKLSLYFQVVLALIISICTGRMFYSIIYLFGGFLSIAGFLSMVKIVDRLLQVEKKRSQGPYFLVSGMKLAVISAGFYLVSRISETAVLFYMLGISVIPLSIIGEGGYQLYRSFSNGKT